MIDRYSRKHMRDLWNEDSKYSFWAMVERAHLQTLIENKQAPAQILDEFDSAVKNKTSKDYLEREKETNHDVIAFIAELCDTMKNGSAYLHKGLTSSDVVDTALALRIIKSLDIIDESITLVLKHLKSQALKHKTTLCMGRTHGIHAEPISFGQVLLSHYAEFKRAHEELLEAREHISYGKLSGAVGNYTQHNPEFEISVLKKLSLKVEPVSTQIIPRDRILTVAKALLSCGNATERFATNMRHWARTELGEVFEPFGKKQKGSSAMPHKKNPILSENLCGLSRTIRGYFTMLMENGALWHERDISHSSVERVALPDMFAIVDFMLVRLADVVENMNININALLNQIWKTEGLWASQNILTALVEKDMNRTEAYECVQNIALSLQKFLDETEMSTYEAEKECLFQKMLSQNKIVCSYLTKIEIQNAFSLQKYLKYVPDVFDRVFNSSKN